MRSAPFDADDAHAPGDEPAGAWYPDATPRRLRYATLALLITLVALLLRPWDYWEALQKLRPATTLTLLVAAIAAGSGVRPRLFRTPLFTKLLCLWVAMFVTSLFSSWLSQSLELAVRYGFQVLLFLVVTHVLVATESLYRVGAALSLAGAFLGAAGLRAYFAGELGVDSRITGVGEGLTSDPNDLAHTLSMLTPLACFALFAGRNLLQRVLLGVLPLALLLGGTIATQSRGGLLATAVGIVVFFGLMQGAKLPRLVALVGIGLVGWLAVPDDAVQRYATITEIDEDESAMSRLAVWRAGGRMFADHPFTGVGMGQFATVYGTQYLDRQGAGAVWRVAHNSIVEVACELGVVGLACWLALVGGAGVALSGCRRVLKCPAAEDPDTQRLRLWCSTLLASWCAFFCGAMFLSRAFDISLVLLLSLISASVLVAGDWSEAYEDESEHAEHALD